MNQALFRRLFSGTPTFLSSGKQFSSEVDQIIIPRRIERGPTDILRALAKTHKRDLTAPHYKYHDDPYLIPYSNSTKRSYALSMEAGRKAAVWIRQEHADLFTHMEADPPIQSFLPKPIISPEEATIDDLKKAVQNLLVPYAMELYTSLDQRSIEIDSKLKQSLLELLCFYNCEEASNDTWKEEEWHRNSDKLKAGLRKSWKDNGLAEKVFKSISPPTPESYSAIIAGMSRYGQLEKATAYFEEALAKDIALSVTVYNSLLSRVNFIKDNFELMWALAMDILKTMDKKGVRPNLGTLNALLETLSYMSSYKHSQKYALNTLSEMKRLGIKPSLASFYHLINIYYTEKNHNSGILIDMVEYLENDEITCQDVLDCHFFSRAMEMCRHKLHNVDLGYRIHALLYKGDNYNFIGDSFKESHYYRYYFCLICEGESIDDFMKFYDELVPHLYIPEPSVMLEVLSSVELNMAYHYLPKLWSDILLFDLADRILILNKLLTLMIQSTDESLKKSFVEIGWGIWKKIENEKRERSPVCWSGESLSDLMLLLLKCGEKAKANLVLDRMVRSRSKISGEPDINTLGLFIDTCIADNAPDIAIKCISYCKDMSFLEVNKFGEQLKSSIPLSQSQLARLNSILENSLSD